MLFGVVQILGRGEHVTDMELMDQLVNREERALDHLYDRYSRAVYSLVLRITGQRASAQEIVQEVFLQLWRNAHAYQPSRGPVAPWLLTLARYRALDCVRGKAEKQRQREEGVETFSPQVTLPNPEQWVDQKRRAEQVRKLLGALPEPQRRAVELAYFEGLTHSEIAETMDEPLGTVKTWIRTALLQMRKELSEKP